MVHACEPAPSANLSHAPEPSLPVCRGGACHEPHLASVGLGYVTRVVPRALVMGWVVVMGLTTPLEAVAHADPLVVAVKEAPPFAVKAADGTWGGTSVELWRDLATDLEVEFEFRETDLPGLLDGVAQGEFDAGVAAITVTSEREQVLDFTHPFHTTGLAIALPTSEPSVWSAIVGAVVSPAFRQLVLGLGGLFLVVGTAMWLVERRSNPQFGTHAGRGIGNGFWWTVVTMTTVGYGDKTPQTTAGRSIALGWMLASVVIISSFTATIAATMTVTRLESRVTGASDLPRVHVGTVAATTSETYLREEHLDFRTYPDAVAGLRDLESGAIEAFVYDAPLLELAITEHFSDRLRILPHTFQRQDYAFALPTKSPLREEINRRLPAKLRGSDATAP